MPPKSILTPIPGTPTTRAKPFGGAQQGAAKARADAKADAEARTIVIDLLAFASHLAAYIEPKQPADAEAALSLLAHGIWFDALMTGASKFPYIGDLVKTGELPQYLKSIQKAVDLANADEKFAIQLLPGFRRLYQAMELLPQRANEQIDLMRSTIMSFLRYRGSAKLASFIPDISRHFQFRIYTKMDSEYHEAAGWLGIPNKVKQHRNITAQKQISAGSGDDAGHLIGNRFGPPGDDKNLGPQNWKANRFGTYQALEKDWARKLEEGNGIHVKITDVYKVGQVRPFYRAVKWIELDTTGMPKEYELDFMNAHTPESRDKQGIEPTVDKPQTDNVIVIDFQNRRRN